MSPLIKNQVFYCGEGRHRVCLMVHFTGDGLVCQLYGGDNPHVGAVVLTVPRPSLQDPGRISCNSSVLPLLGHKEDELAKPLAEGVAVHFNQPVVLVAGIHVDYASEEDIYQLVANCQEVLGQLLRRCPEEI